MEKSYKLKGDNYIDSNSVLHKRQKLSSILDVSFAKLVTNFFPKIFDRNNSVKVTGWNNATEAGDYTADANNSRIIIKNTKLLQIYGGSGGMGTAYIDYHITDSDGNYILNDYSGTCLLQFGGNGYWIQALPNTVIELDPSKTYYLELYARGYTADFRMNDGFGSTATWMSALKLA